MKFGVMFALVGATTGITASIVSFGAGVGTGVAAVCDSLKSGTSIQAPAPVPSSTTSPSPAPTTTPPANTALQLNTPTSIQPQGSTPEQQTWNFFKAEGVDDLHDAAAMASFNQESGFDSTRIEDGFGPTDSQNPDDAGGGGWGLAQWTPGAKIVNIASSYGITTPIYELGTQLQIVWQEMTTGPTPTGAHDFLNQFMSQTTLETATKFFTENFEGPSVVGPRLTYAETALAKFAGTGAAAGNAASDLCGSGSDARTGTSSVYVVGDSITVGLSTEGSLQQKFAAKGITVTKIEATVGIGIAASEAKLSQDAAQIKAADTVVIELGTNDYTADQGTDEDAIQHFDQTLTSINPTIKKYWVDPYSYQNKLSMSHIDKAIAARAAPDSLTVIPWEQEATEHASKYTFDSLSVHQATAAGYSNMAAYIVSQIPTADGVDVTGASDPLDRLKVVQAAESYLGVPYVFGGSSMSGIDCSGLVMEAFQGLITFPHQAAQQYYQTQDYTVVSAGQPTTNAKPGDLVFYDGSDGSDAAPGHVAIVVNSTTVIQAPQSGEVVKRTPMKDMGAFIAVTDPFAWRDAHKAA